MEPVLLKPQRAFSPDELQPLVDGIRALGFEVTVDPYTRANDGSRAGASWWEIVHVYLPHALEIATGATAGALLKDAAKDLAKGAITKVAKDVGGVFVGWAKDRARRPGKNPKQPRVVEIFGPDGKVVSRVKVTDPDSDPEITE